MAKKTTAGKGSSSRKKPAETVEDAEVVEEISSAAEDTASAATEDEVAEVTEPATEDASGAASEDAAVDADAKDPEAPADEPGVDGEAAEETDTSEEAGSVDADDATDVPEADESITDDTASETDASVSEPVEPAPAPPAPVQEVKSGNPAGLIFGGVLAGAIGFFAAYFYDGVNQPLPPEPVDLSGLEQSIDDQSQRIDDLAASIPEATPAPDLSGLEGEIAQIAAALSDLEARVVALETQPPAEPGTAAVDPGVMDDLAALQATVAALQEENETAKANAREAAEGTLKRAAFTQVQTALESGAPFVDAMAELEQLGVEMPAELTTNAADGVPTLAGLQEAFPAAARAALAADREAAAASGDTGGVVDFLRSQLGARSLTPQEGDGTDAVLSRAEAALRDGQIADALAELETLPEVAQPALADWSTLASTRADALAAAQALSDSLN